MKNKTVLIGAGIVGAGILAYLFYTKNKKAPVAVDDAGGGGGGYGGGGGGVPIYPNQGAEQNTPPPAPDPAVVVNNNIDPFAGAKAVVAKFGAAVAAEMNKNAGNAQPDTTFVFKGGPVFGVGVKPALPAVDPNVAKDKAGNNGPPDNRVGNRFGQPTTSTGSPTTTGGGSTTTSGGAGKGADPNAQNQNTGVSFGHFDGGQNIFKALGRYRKPQRNRVGTSDLDYFGLDGLGITILK